MFKPSECYDTSDSDNTCYLCETPHYKLVYNISHYDFPFTFKRCQCGLVKQTPMPNEQFFEFFFNSELFFSAKKTEKSRIWGYYDYFEDEPSRVMVSKRRYNKLSHLFEKLGHPLDIMKIGASTGFFLHILKQHGHNALGCDVSSQFVDYAKRHYNVRIDNGRFEHMDYADGQFDVIFLFSVLENISNPAEFLNAIYRTLKPGGYFILNFVDMEKNVIARLQKSNYFIYRPPVCYIYTMSVFEKVMNKYGFKIVKCHRDIRYLTIEKISTLLGWKWMLTLFRFLKLSRLHFPIYAYPSKIVVVRKNE